MSGLSINSGYEPRKDTQLLGDREMHVGHGHGLHLNHHWYLSEWVHFHREVVRIIGVLLLLFFCLLMLYYFAAAQETQFEMVPYDYYQFMWNIA